MGRLPDLLVHAYLERLGIDRPPLPTLRWLRRLHNSHLQKIPFENLSIHLGEPIVLDPVTLVRKLVDRRRGGFCYELNGAFAELLRSLGYDVTLLAARVFHGNLLGPPFDHLCLRVQLREPWLVDVGFGDFIQLPLRLDSREPQRDPNGTFVIAIAIDGHFDVIRDGEPQYRFDLIPRQLHEYEPTCKYHQTSPKSDFTHKTICSIATAAGRTTITGNRLIRQDSSGRAERTLSDEELLRAYRDLFDIELASTPRVAGDAG